MSARFLPKLAMAALLLCAGAARARAAWHAEVATDKDSGVAISLTSPFDHSPVNGYLPLWITVRNDSGAARTWTVLCSGGALFGNFGSRELSDGSLRVESGQTARAPILMALNPSDASSFYRAGSIRVDGYAVPLDATTQVPGANSNDKNNRTPVIGMSEPLATPIWASLTKRYADLGSDLQGTPVDLGLLGGDWRALAGLDALWLSDADFAALDAPRRAAIHDWTLHGGRLCVCAQTADPSLRAALGLPEGAGEADAGLGHVELLAWDGKPLSLDVVSGKIDGLVSRRAGPAAGAEWPMLGEIGRIPLHVPFLIAFIVAFAVVVGPLNLFWFANASRRHRLFWTTPLLSVGASLLLAGFIALQDGFGGRGERAMLCLLLPEEKKAVVTQEQVARTGVLISRGFQLTDDAVLTPVPTGLGVERRTREQNGRAYSGDWFSSRSVQALRAEAVVPTRAEVRLVSTEADAAPVVASSVPATIREIRYRDAAGKRWRGENLRTGERITLHGDPATAQEGFAVGGSSLLSDEVKAFGDRPGCFVAVAEDGPFLDTLPSIRWNKQKAVFAGRMAPPR